MQEAGKQIVAGCKEGMFRGFRLAIGSALMLAAVFYFITKTGKSSNDAQQALLLLTRQAAPTPNTLTMYETLLTSYPEHELLQLLRVVSAGDIGTAEFVSDNYPELRIIVQAARSNVEAGLIDIANDNSGLRVTNNGTTSMLVHYNFQASQTNSSLDLSIGAQSDITRNFVVAESVIDVIDGASAIGSFVRNTQTTPLIDIRNNTNRSMLPAPAFLNYDSSVTVVLAPGSVVIGK